MYWFTDFKYYWKNFAWNSNATEQLGATILRNELGNKTLSQILTQKEIISTAMQVILDEATEPWGIKVDRVEMWVFVLVGSIIHASETKENSYLFILERTSRCQRPCSVQWRLKGKPRERRKRRSSPPRGSWTRRTRSRRRRISSRITRPLCRFVFAIFLKHYLQQWHYNAMYTNKTNLPLG